MVLHRAGYPIRGIQGGVVNAHFLCDHFFACAHQAHKTIGKVAEEAFEVIR